MFTVGVVARMVNDMKCDPTDIKIDGIVECSNCGKRFSSQIEPPDCKPIPPDPQVEPIGEKYRPIGKILRDSRLLLEFDYVGNIYGEEIVKELQQQISNITAEHGLTKGNFTDYVGSKNEELAGLESQLSAKDELLKTIKGQIGFSGSLEIDLAIIKQKIADCYSGDGNTLNSLKGEDV